MTGWEPWQDPQRWAGVVHDWLYSQPGVSKSHADAVFRALLASEGASSWKRKLMYAAVVTGGWWAFDVRQAGRAVRLLGARRAEGRTVRWRQPRDRIHRANAERNGQTLAVREALLFTIVDGGSRVSAESVLARR